MNSEVYSRLRKNIDNFKVIDTHEHTFHEDTVNRMRLNIIDLAENYLEDDMRSADIEHKHFDIMKDARYDFELRLKCFKILFERCRYGAYGRHFLLNMKRHFGIDDITLESAKKVAEHFNDINYKGYFEKIYDDNNVEAVLSFVTYHKGCFTDTGRSKREYCVPHIGDYSPISSERLSLLEQESDIKISSLRDVDSAIDTLVKFYKTHRAPALKVSSGYYRLLDIHDADAPTAELYLEKVVNGDELTDREKDVLDDYCLHLLCKKAQKYDLPVIFHVGIHAGGQNMLERARANYLTNLVSTYKGVNFVILHCGIPYIEEAVMLSKYYTNVFLDMTWTHIIDAHKTVELIKQIVEAVPINKVFAFGGDLSHPYNGMAHLSIAKDNLARAFSQLIEMERMTDLDAENIIKMWLYDNPKQFYKL